jgi:adenylate kinase
LHRRLTAVVYLHVSDAAIINRLSGRLICRDCQAPFHRTLNPPQIAGRCDRCGGALYTRTDDAAETVAARLVTYHRQTEPLIAAYRSTGLLREVAGEGGVPAVAERVLGVVNDLGPATATPSSLAHV